MVSSRPDRPCSRMPGYPAPAAGAGIGHATREAAAFLDFLDTVEGKYRGRETHVILDNFSTHSTAAVSEWLADHPDFHFHSPRSPARS